jgi:DNA sulfur modification protein DndE
MSIEYVRLSQQAKEQLIRLKRFTGIQNWNVLCRWAFCVSLSEPTKPSVGSTQPDSALEMTWKVFGGEYQEIYLALLKERCRRDGLVVTDENLSTQLRLHLHRGIAELAADRQIKAVDRQIKGLVALLSRAERQHGPTDGGHN